MINFIYWKIFALYSHWCKFRLFSSLPNLKKEIANYSKKSKTTGTKFPTLWRAVQIILKEKPSTILESGTGLSTIVLAATLKKLKAENNNYNGKITSMESVEEWYKMAKKNLPKKYGDIVEIRLGKRKKMEFLFFRGFIHSNIPVLNYDFVFLDGPSYQDKNGGAFNADIFYALDKTSMPSLRGVIDTRVSSAFVLQQVFGTNSIRYFPLTRTSDFLIKKKEYKVKISSRDFLSDWKGKLSFKLLEKKNN